jgi:conjugative transfer signal peptidase TraF
MAAKLALSGHLLVNFTPSIPRGLYWIHIGETPRRGALVAVPIPESVRDLVYDRHYVPRSIQLLAKPVAAVGDDQVCLRDHQLFVNGALAGNVLDVDREGHPLPQHPLCARLPESSLFLATRHDDSFDSRYFGPVPVDAVRGTLTPLWTF